MQIIYISDKALEYKLNKENSTKRSPIYLKYQKQANPHKQKANGLLQWGVGGILTA